MGSRMRVNRGATGRRRSHHKAVVQSVVTDKEDAIHVRHHISRATGTYKGRQILDVDKRAERRARRLKKIGEEARDRGEEPQVDVKEEKKENSKQKALDPQALSEK